MVEQNGIERQLVITTTILILAVTIPIAWLRRENIFETGNVTTEEIARRRGTHLVQMDQRRWIIWNGHGGRIGHGQL